MHPLAGSRDATPTPYPTREAAAALKSSDKDQREHRAVAEAVFDALNPYCSSFRRRTQRRWCRMATMWHLGTRIVGKLKDPSTSAAELAAVLHPTPAVCGLPRDHAAEVIRELESYDRGFYAGAVGLTDESGDGQWFVSLRCAEVAGSRARLYAGAGIVPGWDRQARWELDLGEIPRHAEGARRRRAGPRRGGQGGMIPLAQTWPSDFAERYRRAGHWRGEMFPAMLQDRAASFPHSYRHRRRRTALDLWRIAAAGRDGCRRIPRARTGARRPGRRAARQHPRQLLAVFGLFLAGIVPVYALPAHRLTEIAHFARKAEASAYVVAATQDGFDYRARPRGAGRGARAPACDRCRRRLHVRAVRCFRGRSGLCRTPARSVGR